MMKKGVISLEVQKTRRAHVATNAFISVPASKKNSENGNRRSEGVPINHGITRAAGVDSKSLKKSTNRENIIYSPRTPSPLIFTSSIIRMVLSRFSGSHFACGDHFDNANKPCMVGCANAVINLEQKTVTFKGGEAISSLEGELVTRRQQRLLYRHRAAVEQLYQNHQHSRCRQALIRQRQPKGEKIIREKSRFSKETGFKKRVVTSVPAEQLKGAMFCCASTSMCRCRKAKSPTHQIDAAINGALPA